MNEFESKVFGPSQILGKKWLAANYDGKLRIPEVVFLNCVLDEVTLVPPVRKPSDILAEALISEKNRDDKTSIELFIAGIGDWEVGGRRDFFGKVCRHATPK